MDSASYLKKARDLESQAEQKLRRHPLDPFGFFGGPNYEEISDLFNQAGNTYRLVKDYGSSAKAFLRASDYQSDPKEKAMMILHAYDMGKDYQHLQQAVMLLAEAGDYYQAAKRTLELAQIYESQGNYQLAIDSYKQAVEWFGSQTVKVNQCLQSLAQLHQRQGQYFEAGQVYESLGFKIFEGPLKFQAKDYFFRATICYLAVGDDITARKKFQEYQDLDPNFAKSRENSLIVSLLHCLNDNDPQSFAGLLVDYENLSSARLDNLLVKTLLQIKKTIEVEDLT